MRRHRRIRKSVFIIGAAVIVVAGVAAFAIQNHAGKASSSQRDVLAQAVSSGSSSSQISSQAPSSDSSSPVSSQQPSSGSSSSQGNSQKPSDEGKDKTNFGKATIGSLLMLVNKDNKLPANYVPNLTTIPAKYYSSADKDRRFDSRAASYLENFINDARKAGYDVNIISGYRTYQYQKANFDRHVKAFLAKGETQAEAEAHTALSVAPPGTSEHQTGLAADIITSDWYSKHSELTEDFDKTAAFKWLYKNCANYGFILRYPKDKENITKYEYEPWHYRFVGVSDAKKIMSSGKCLEEYVKK